MLRLVSFAFVAMAGKYTAPAGRTDNRNTSAGR
jgi:hypothetical protein